MRAKLLALIAGSAIALTAAAPANAAAWNGNDFQFGYGARWEFDDFYVDDIEFGSTSESFTQPYAGGTGTDIWDGGLYMDVTSPTLGLSDDQYDCNGVDSDIDITTDGSDLSIDCLTDWNEPNDPDVSIRGNIRIYGPDGDLVRYLLKITNNTNSDITDFEVGTMTDFGSSGDIWGYQNFDADILDVPALENNANAAALEAAEANWIVNIDGNDASGSLAWGTQDTSSVDVAVIETDGDTYYTSSDVFTVKAGATVYLAYFTGWDPQSLLSVGYDPDRFAIDDTDADAEANADAVVVAAAEFNDFTGRLTAGLPDGANVINWGPAPAEDLADTGADVSSLWAGLGLLVAGVGVVAVRRRARA